MKKIKLLKSIIVISLCLSMAFACSINTFALSTGPKASNKTYNSTSYFMIDGTFGSCCGKIKASCTST